MRNSIDDLFIGIFKYLGIMFIFALLLHVWSFHTLVGNTIVILVIVILFWKLLSYFSPEKDKIFTINEKIVPGKKVIYAYTTKTYGKNNLYKIGCTNRDARSRVKEQDNSSNPEELIVVYEIDLSHLNLEKLEIESQIFIKLRNYRQRKEWFRLNGGLKQLDNTIYELWGVGNYERSPNFIYRLKNILVKLFK
jgi:hypothetical protein